MARFIYKFFLTAVVLLASTFISFSKNIAYNNKGCNSSFGVVLQDSTYYIVVSLNSSGHRFLAEPTIMLKTFDGEVIKLNGSNSGELTKTAGGTVIGNTVVSSSKIISTALFTTTPEQFELIKNGISKVRLSTMPVENEKTFKKDKIGEKIYNLYTALRDRGDDF